MAKVSSHHRKLMQDVNRDVNDMILYRRPAIKNAEQAIQGYMALNIGAKPGRSTFFPPVLHAIVWSRMALEAAEMPDVTYKARLASSEPLMKFLNAAKKSAEAGDGNLRAPSLANWYKQNFDKLLFGVGFRYLTWMLWTRKVNIKDSNGKWKEKTVVEYDDIWDENLNFFYTGVSRDTQPGMFGGTSAYTDRFYRKEHFASMFQNNPMYMNIDLALEMFGAEEWIRVRTYWNLFGDLYFVQAMHADEDMYDEVGEGIPIREDYILEYGPSDRPQKMIPITSIHGEYSFDTKIASMPDLTLMTNAGRAYTDLIAPSRKETFWTKGNSQIVKGLITLKRSMWRAWSDNMKSSTVKFLMSQNPGVLNQIKRADLYGVVPMKADERSFNVQSLLEPNEVMQGIQEYDDALDTLGAEALGHDWRDNAAQMTNETATVAAIRANMKNQRGALGQGMNEAMGITRHYKLLLNLIQQFYPEKTRVMLADEEELPDGIHESNILRDGDGDVIGYEKQKMVNFDEPVIVKYDQKGEISSIIADETGDKQVPATKGILVTPEEPEIYLEPASTFAKQKAIERALDIERQQKQQFWLGLSYPDPKNPQQPKPLIGKEGALYWLKKSSDVWEDDYDQLTKADDQTTMQPDIPPPFAGASMPPKPNRQPQQPMQPPAGMPNQQPNGMPQQVLPQTPANIPVPGMPSPLASQLTPAAR